MEFSDRVKAIRTRLYRMTASECEQVQRIAMNLARDKGRAEFAARVAERWAIVSQWQHGQEVWVCFAGTRLGPRPQRGDKLVVKALKPRARELWCQDAAGKWVGFSAADCLRDDLRTTPPETVCSARDRAFGRELGQVLTETMAKVTA